MGSTAISVAIYRPDQKNPEHSFVLTPAEPSRQLGLLEPGARPVVALAFDKNNHLLAGGTAQATVLAGQTSQNSQVSLERTAEYKPETAQLQQLTSLLPATQAATGVSSVDSPNPGVLSGGTVIIPVIGNKEQAAQGMATSVPSAVASTLHTLPAPVASVLPVIGLSAPVSPTATSTPTRAVQATAVPTAKPVCVLGVCL